MRKILALRFALIVSVPPAIAQEAQTLKERLSDKASDAQRVDNCHVPPERRGAQRRPDCPEQPRSTSRDPPVPRPRRRANRLRLQRTLRADVKRIDRRAAADEQPVPERSAKAQIGAGLRQMDL